MSGTGNATNFNQTGMLSLNQGQVRGHSFISSNNTINITNATVNQINLDISTSTSEITFSGLNGVLITPTVPVSLGGTVDVKAPVNRLNYVIVSSSVSTINILPNTFYLVFVAATVSFTINYSSDFYLGAQAIIVSHPINVNGWTLSTNNTNRIQLGARITSYGGVLSTIGTGSVSLAQGLGALNDGVSVCFTSNAVNSFTLT